MLRALLLRWTGASLLLLRRTGGVCFEASVLGLGNIKSFVGRLDVGRRVD